MSIGLLEGQEYVQATKEKNELISMKVTMDTRLRARMIVTVTGETIQDLFERLVDQEFNKHRRNLANMLGV